MNGSKNRLMSEGSRKKRLKHKKKKSKDRPRRHNNAIVEKPSANNVRLKNAEERNSA